VFVDLARRLRGYLPNGHPLAPQEWRLRHRMILYVLVLHVVGVFIFGVARGFGPAHSAADVAPIAVAALAASSNQLSNRLRSVVATLGLLTASAVLVHLSGGLIEFHFHYFVMLMVIISYQDWAPFLVAVAFVLIEHAVVGVIAPHAVYNSPQAWASPLKWAGLHALFVAGAGVAAIAGWRITEKAQAAERVLADRLAYEAAHDPLTGALNRREFERRVAAALAAPAAGQPEQTLCLVDLDRFKIINDTSGHAAGDHVLRQVTMLLGELLTEGDSLARLGGDEFGVLIGSCPPDQATLRAEALRTAVASHRFSWEGHVFTLGASVGVAVVTAATGGVEEVIRAADAACYVAKGKGRNRTHLYQPDDAELARQQGDSEWAARLLSAIRENRLELYYQRIVPVESAHRPVRFGELLLRLRDENGALVPPGAFLPAAERYHLLSAVDRWVVATAFAALDGRYRSGYAADEIFTINLSGVSAGDETFLAFVRAKLADHAVPTDVICFELTETVAITNLAVAIRFMDELRSLGCRFALDDFGSGLSSFAYLKNLPVDFLKVDGNFVRGITHDPIDRAMVEAINTIGQRMGLRTVAEHVETDATLRCLRDLGVDFAQGYAIGRPEPFTDWLLAHPAPAARLAV
jgi:diguanylate cyclase (GGDEF)-like protein